MFFSQSGEDKILFEKYFKNYNHSNGVFLEMGALDGILYSNTKFYEDTLGWKGILIEPNPVQYNKLISNRPKAKCYNELVSDLVEPIEFQYFLEGHAAVSGVKDTLPQSHFDTYFNRFTNLPQSIIKMKPKSLTSILNSSGYDHIDFFSLDVEGHELNVLKSLDFQNTIPIYLILMENLGDTPENELCKEILQSNGFEYQGKCAHNDVYINKNFKHKEHKLNLKYPNKIIGTKSVVIAGCCRNVENFITQNLQVIDLIGTQFGKYQVLLFENDSTDSTRQILYDRKKPNYEYIFEDNVNIQKRTERIAFCRNKLLDKIYSDYSSFDYVLFVDMDDVLASGKLAETIGSCFMYNTDQWDGMFANSSSYYYDIWALRKKGYLDSDVWNNVYMLQSVGMGYQQAVDKCVTTYQINYPVDSKIIPVISAFGGAGLYKLSTLISLKPRYNGVEPTHINGMICEHVPFNQFLSSSKAKLFINPKMLVN